MSDTAISFCEPPYIYTESIAEFWNSASSLAYSVAALAFFREMRLAMGNFPGAFPLGVWMRFAVCGVSVFLLGLGSAIFHATLTWWGELMDEGAMMVSVFTYILCQQDLHPLTSGSKKRWFYSGVTGAMLSGLSLYIYAVNHDVFAGIFAVLVAIAGLLYATSPLALVAPSEQFEMKPDAVLEARTSLVSSFFVGVILALSGYLSWWVDQTCVRWNLKHSEHGDWMFWFHVLWHLFTAVGLWKFLLLLVRVRVALHMAAFLRTSSGSFVPKKHN